MPSARIEAEQRYAQYQRRQHERQAEQCGSELCAPRIEPSQAQGRHGADDGGDDADRAADDQAVPKRRRRSWDWPAWPPTNAATALRSGNADCASTGEGEQHDEDKRRQQEHHEQRCRCRARRCRTRRFIVAATAPERKIDKQDDGKRRAERDERHRRAHRPVAETAELRRDLHADHVDLAADQLRRQIVAGREQEAEGEAGR